MKKATKDARGFIEGVKKSMHVVLPHVQPVFTKVTYQAKKERAAVVTTAVDLNQSEKLALERILVRLLGHDIQCGYHTDSTLLGGMKVQVADWVVDSSLQTQLKTLSTSLQSI